MPLAFSSSLHGWGNRGTQEVKSYSKIIKNGWFGGNVIKSAGQSGFDLDSDTRGRSMAYPF